jgi:ubiquitin-protein ligase
MATNTKRIGKELEKFYKSGHNTIFLLANDDNLLDLRGLVIGPDDTPFEGTFLYFSIKPENYPNDPPKVKFLTPYSVACRMHPNLYAEGKVCLSILGTWGNMEWSPLLTFEKILLTIQGLLDNNPIAHEPGFEKADKNKCEQYAVQSRWLALNSVIHMLNRKDLPQYFIEKIREYFTNNFQKYMKSLKILEQHHNKTYNTIHGNHIINTQILSEKLLKTYEQLK